MHRASAIIDHLRTFARTTSTLFKPVAIHQAIRSAASLVEAELRASHVELSMKLCSDDSCCWAT